MSAGASVSAEETTGEDLVGLAAVGTGDGTVAVGTLLEDAPGKEAEEEDYDA